ncbi:MAG: hypothetical protein OEX12_11520 [Gammaproteobacteria bacterium]|nr:hypothetical protein [Gammaproteobacteria bacterium]
MSDIGKTYVQEYDEEGNKVYREDGTASFILKEKREHEPNTTVITSKKADKTFHHEAGKGSRRR